MKTETYTIKDAFAWDKHVLMKKLMLENNKSFVLGDVNLGPVIGVPSTPYYSTAVHMSMTRYIADKVCILDHDIKVEMTVKTKDGIEHPFNIRLGHLFNSDSNMVDLIREIVEPTVATLASEASKEIKFSDVESVSCYVEEINSIED